MRSVIEYPCFISGSCNKGIMDKLEILQNHALRIVLKKRQIDHVTIESLREEANVSAIEKRHQKLLLAYFDKAINNNNPLIMELIKYYWEFRKRNILINAGR